MKNKQANLSTQVTIRLSTVTVRQLDQRAAELSRERPGLRVSRADVIRMLVQRELQKRTLTGVE